MSHQDHEIDGFRIHRRSNIVKTVESFWDRIKAALNKNNSRYRVLAQNLFDPMIIGIQQDTNGNLNAIFADDSSKAPVLPFDEAFLYVHPESDMTKNPYSLFPVDSTQFYAKTDVTCTYSPLFRIYPYEAVLSFHAYDYQKKVPYAIYVSTEYVPISVHLHSNADQKPRAAVRLLFVPIPENL